MKKRFAVTFSFLVLFCGLMAHDVELPTGFVMEEFFIDGLAQPTDLKIAPDGRIFIAEKTGTIRIIENGQLLDQPFYTVSTQSPNERGLVGIALDPNFDLNGYVYMMYSLPIDNQNIVARVTSSGYTAIPGSEIELIRFDRMWSAFHNGGGMVFDQSGKLIIGTGDGTGYTTAQDMESTLGKILRINTDGSIPTDNPFYTENTGIYRSIAAYGVRNPYTMAVSKVSGRIFFNDVGNLDFEEINAYIPGKNYGWYPIEGMLNGGTSPGSNYQDPIHAYDHEDGKCAVVGASFYEPETPQFPAGYNGKYFFMDLCNGTLSYLDPNSYEVTVFGSGLVPAYNNLEVSPDGSLYLINVVEGNLAKISYVGVDAPPLISEQPASQVVAVNENVRFSVEASGEDLDFRWFKNGTLIQPVGTSSITLNNVQLVDDQTQISVTVSNQNGSVNSNIAGLTVVDGSRPRIQFQHVPTSYAAGDTIPFSALVSDPDQQEMLPQSLTWEIDFHHNEHAHPAFTPTTGIDSGFYVVERFGEVDTNVFFRIHLKAQDSTGLTAEKFIDVLPEKITMLVTTQPEGVEVNIDGSKETTNFPLRSVKSLNRTIQAPPYMVIGDSLYQFSQWEDGQDTLIRVFEAQNDTISILYQGVEAYAAGIPSLGNLAVFEDTGSVRQYYSSLEVSQIRENWDVLNPFFDVKPPFPTDYWSAQWTGAIHPPVTGLYTFYLFHDGKVSLFLEDSLLLDNSLSAHDVQEDTIQVWLNGGEHLDLRLEYDHHEYVARVQLDWSFSIIDRYTIPFSKFYPKENLEKDDDGIALFPNPTQDPIVYLYINPESYNQSSIDIQIFDSNGRLYDSFAADLDNGIYPLSVSELSSGLYYLNVRYGEKDKTLKFIKE